MVNLVPFKSIFGENLQYETLEISTFQWVKRNTLNNILQNYTMVNTSDMVQMSGPVIGRTKPRRKGAAPPRVTVITEGNLS